MTASSLAQQVTGTLGEPGATTRNLSFIVPGPHDSCELPQTIAELDRILRLHLNTSNTSRATVAQAIP